MSAPPCSPFDRLRVANGDPLFVHGGVMLLPDTLSRTVGGKNASRDKISSKICLLEKELRVNPTYPYVCFPSQTHPVMPSLSTLSIRKK